jgi:hypothetical protein
MHFFAWILFSERGNPKHLQVNETPFSLNSTDQGRVRALWERSSKKAKDVVASEFIEPVPGPRIKSACSVWIHKHRR